MKLYISKNIAMFLLNKQECRLFDKKLNYWLIFGLKN